MKDAGFSLVSAALQLGARTIAGWSREEESLAAGATAVSSKTVARLRERIVANFNPGTLLTGDGLGALNPSGAGVPAGPIYKMAEVFADPQVIDQEMVLTQHHPGHGDVRMLGFPIKFTEAPCRLRRPAPEIGGDTEAVLGELGYSAAEIGRLRATGAA